MKSYAVFLISLIFNVLHIHYYLDQQIPISVEVKTTVLIGMARGSVVITMITLSPGTKGLFKNFPGGHYS